MTAQNHVECDEIDQAIGIYQQLQLAARVFLLLGMLCADNKGNFEHASSYYEQGMQIQERVC